MKIKSLFLAVLLLVGVIACIEDTIQLEDISKEIEMERSISIPLLKASLLFDDLGGGGYEDIDLLSNGDTAYFYLIEDITIEDTVEFSEIGLNMDFDFINIHHKITNMFPLNLDLNLYLYNENEGRNIDTIQFKSEGDEFFIVAPSVIGDNGLIDEGSVETRSGSINLDNDLLDNLFSNTSHIILFAKVAETDTIVKILGRHSLNVGLGLSAKGRYIVNLDSLNLMNDSI